MSGTARELMLERTNRDFYEPLWGEAQLIAPERFNTWPLVASLLRADSRCLEVAPGLRPRLPLAGTQFVDISERAVARLREAGARAEIGTILDLPVADRTFDLVCAMDVIEHVDDDVGALSELTRVLAPHGTLLISVPLHQSNWTAFDDFVGHCRRYEPARLTSLLAQFGLRVESSAVYGMAAALLSPSRSWAVVSRQSTRAGDVVVQPGIHAARHPVSEAAETGRGADRGRERRRGAGRVQSSHRVSDTTRGLPNRSMAVGPYVG